MEQKILSMLSYGNYNFNILLAKLGVASSDLKNTLQEMISKKMIFLNCHGKYSKIHKGYLTGELKKTSKNVFYIEKDGNIIYIDSENLHTALLNDEVVVVEEYYSYGKVIGITERKNKYLVCEVVRKKNTLNLVPFNIDYPINIVISDKNITKNLIEGERYKIILEDIANTDNILLVNNIQYIGHKNDPKNDEKAIAISRGFNIDFSPEIEQQLEKIPTYVTEEEKKDRSDLTNKNIFTIDPLECKDMDDAISLEKYGDKYLLGVHISDVAHYIKYNTPLYHEASLRNTSLYLGDTCISLFPHKISNGICSLNENDLKLTKSHFILINSDGEIEKYARENSFIKSKKKMNYKEVDKVLNNEDYDPSYEPFVKNLALMFELSDILTSYRLKKGLLEFAPQEIKCINKNNSIEFKQREKLKSHKLIENFMIIANYSLALDMFYKQIPFIFRNHYAADKKKLEQAFKIIQHLKSKNIVIPDDYDQFQIQKILNLFKDTEQYEIISNLLLRSNAKAFYSTDNIGHFALALPHYCHSTAPIRRFGDFVIQHIQNEVDNYEIKDNAKLSFVELNELAKYSSFKEIESDVAERDYLKLEMAKEMQKHIGEVYTGIISDIDYENIYIRLSNNVTGILDKNYCFNSKYKINTAFKELYCIDSNKFYPLGTHVRVKIKSVNVLTKEINLGLLELNKSKSLTLKKK